MFEQEFDEEMQKHFDECDDCRAVLEMQKRMSEDFEHLKVKDSFLKNSKTVSECVMEEIAKQEAFVGKTKKLGRFSFKHAGLIAACFIVVVMTLPLIPQILPKKAASFDSAENEMIAEDEFATEQDYEMFGKTDASNGTASGSGGGASPVIKEDGILYSTTDDAIEAPAVNAEKPKLDSAVADEKKTYLYSQDLKDSLTLDIEAENNFDKNETVFDDVAADEEVADQEVCESQENVIKNTFAGNMATYYEMADGTWMCNGISYENRLEIKGRLHNAEHDNVYVYLNNVPISFEQAWKASGLSSNSEDYFSPEEAVLVEMRTE